jgi:acylphosphatase
MQAIAIRVTGTVQGVGFRAFVRRTAREFGLVGVVWNQTDGSVEAIVQGPQPQVAACLKALVNGPGEVESIHSETASVDPSRRSFEIVSPPSTRTAD